MGYWNASSHDANVFGSGASVAIAGRKITVRHIISQFLVEVHKETIRAKRVVPVRSLSALPVNDYWLIMPMTLAYRTHV